MGIVDSKIDKYCKNQILKSVEYVSGGVHLTFDNDVVLVLDTDYSRDIYMDVKRKVSTLEEIY